MEFNSDGAEVDLARVTDVEHVGATEAREVVLAVPGNCSGKPRDVVPASPSAIPDTKSCTGHQTDLACALDKVCIKDCIKDGHRRDAPVPIHARQLLSHS